MLKSALSPEADIRRSDVALLGSKGTGVAIAALAAGFLLLYGPVFVQLAGMWRDHDRWEGFLIPLISLYLVWLKRDHLKRLRIKPVTAWGTFTILFASALLVVGNASGIGVLNELSLLVMVVGLVLFLFGWEYARALSLPILYGSLMLTIVEDVVAPLHLPFQLLTARMTVEMLQGLGFAAFLQGQYLVLPHITLEVAQACSGVNYLISIVAIGLPLAYVMLRRWWTRVIVVLSAVALGIVANWLRVLLIAVLAYSTGKMTHGPLHIFQGMFVAWVGYVALFSGSWALSKLEDLVTPKASGGRRLHTPRVSNPVSVDPGSGASWTRPCMTLAVLLTAVATYLSWHVSEPVPLKRDFVTFPTAVANWAGDRAEPAIEIFRLPAADEELRRVYRNAEGWTINLYVAYLRTQRQGKELVSYRTAALHRGGEVVRYTVDSERSLAVNRGRLAEAGGGTKVFFWYDVGGEVIANRHRAKLATTVSALWGGKTNGALVVVAVRQPQNQDEPESRMEEGFLQELIPLLRLYLP